MSLSSKSTFNSSLLTFSPYICVWYVYIASPNLLSHSFSSPLCFTNKIVPHVHLFNQMLYLCLLLFQLCKINKKEKNPSNSHCPTTTFASSHYQDSGEAITASSHHQNPSLFRFIPLKPIKKTKPPSSVTLPNTWASATNICQSLLEY